MATRPPGRYVLCENCLAFEPPVAGVPGDNGVCHRRAPVLLGEPGGGYWPVVSKSDWCAEFVDPRAPIQELWLKALR
jgi:hypothetical protein